MNTPRYTKEYCDLANALREFEQAHAVWMNTCVFTPDGEQAKQNKNDAMRKYAEAHTIWERSQRETIEECH